MEAAIGIAFVVAAIVGIRAFSRNKKTVQAMSQQADSSEQPQQTQAPPAPGVAPPPPPATQSGEPVNLTPQEMMVLDIFRKSGSFGKPPKRTVKRNRFSIWAALKTGDKNQDQQLMSDISVGVDGLVTKGLALEPDKNPESKTGITLTDQGYDLMVER